jgi:hypothetical protein
VLSLTLFSALSLRPLRLCGERFRLFGFGFVLFLRSLD